MLEHIPAWLGKALSDVRAGAEKLAIARGTLGTAIPRIELMSPAFADGARLPERFTADGDGVSPPLVWGPLPDGTAHLALLVEDADAPAPQPLVHAVVWGMPADTGRLEEGAIRSDGAGTPERDVGRNSIFAKAGCRLTRRPVMAAIAMPSSCSRLMQASAIRARRPAVPRCWRRWRGMCSPPGC